MSKGPHRVWRAAPPTLALVIVFCAAAGICVPVLAYLILIQEQSPVLSAFLAGSAVIALLYGWRFGLHPSVRADQSGVTVRNPRRKVRFAWSDITVLAPGENGLLIASEADHVEAWCVQKSRWATKRRRHTRADRIPTSSSTCSRPTTPRWRTRRPGSGSAGPAGTSTDC